jgi:antitoxin YefM
VITGTGAATASRSRPVNGPGGSEGAGGQVGEGNHAPTLKRLWPAVKLTKHAPVACADACRVAASGKVATLIAMSVSEQMPLADVKNHLSEVVDRLQREHGRVIITKHGRPAAVVISVEDLDSLEETLDIMDDATLLSDIRDSLAELSATEAPVLTKEDALRLITGQ